MRGENPAIRTDFFLESRAMSSIQSDSRPARSLAAAVATAVALLWAATTFGQTCLCGSAADDLVAARVGLDREWVVQVPFDSAAWRLEHVVVGDRLVVAQGGDGTVAAVRTDTRPGGARRGSVAWSQRVGGTGPIEAAGVGAKTVVVARGSGVTAFDAATGGVAWKRPLAGIASAGGMSAGGWVYTPLDGGGVSRLPESAWATVRSDGDSDSSSSGTNDVSGIDSKGDVDVRPLAFDNGILWCSSNGLIVALVGEGEQSRRLEFVLGSPASGSPVIRDGDVFVATRAGDLARIAHVPAGLTANGGVYKDSRGRDVSFFGWHAVLEGVPEGSPVVGGGTVVISLGPWGIAGFDAATGQRRWQLAQGGLPLAITDNRVWCLDDTGFLVARDLASGGMRERLCLGCFSLPVVNTASERLVLASPGGLVVSLAPRRVSSATPPAPVALPEAAEPEPAAAEPEPAAADDNA
jgi:outer membrane protein assembly factor BamB